MAFLEGSGALGMFIPPSRAPILSLSRPKISAGSIEASSNAALSDIVRYAHRMVSDKAGITLTSSLVKVR